ncbi:MAG: endonuclease III [bacterium]|nr:endonuclease III [bacterium]
MKDSDIHKIVEILRDAVKNWKQPIVTQIAERGKDPFRILISTILSLRTKDDVTALASERLFSLAKTPEEMLRLGEEEIAKTIYPVGFYRNKAKTIKEICKTLVERYNGKVPDNLEELLKLRGVGRKTANLVITLGYNKPGICVDTHVHRISNRLGYVKTKTPEETEFALREKLPVEYWIEFNDLLVTLGQSICHPISPRCSMCPIKEYCDRIGVKRSR